MLMTGQRQTRFLLPCFVISSKATWQKFTRLRDVIPILGHKKLSQNKDVGVQFPITKIQLFADCDATKYWLGQ